MVGEGNMDNDDVRNFELGISAGYDRSSNFVIDKVVDLFRAGRSREAEYLRSISEELKKMSEGKG